MVEDTKSTIGSGCFLTDEYERRYAKWFELYKTVHADPKDRELPLFTSMRPPQIDGIFVLMRSGRLRGFIPVRLWNTEDQDFLLAHAADLLLRAMGVDTQMDPGGQLNLVEGSQLKRDAQEFIESAFSLDSEFCRSVTPTPQTQGNS